MEAGKSSSDKPPRKKRNLPGMPDPEAEVVALSPTTLMATNRFVCEICNKGFQRDQNLQLHRRGHNLPWKLKQRAAGQPPPRRRVYVCPEVTCVHHSPARALGDLTGIKKHFFRKHGEKKFKCERCSKKYAVCSDWKAHLKTCGTREYRCDCGTLFSRRDSFITHRAFCEALAEESARAVQTVAEIGSPPQPPLTPSTAVLSPGVSVQSSELADNVVGLSPPTPPSATCVTSTRAAASSVSSAASSVNMVFTNVYTGAAPSVTVAVSPQASLAPPASFTNIICSGRAATMPAPGTIEPPPSLSLSPSLYFSTNETDVLFPDCERQYLPSSNAAMSATALLQKAAQMGATSSNASFLRGLGLQTSSAQLSSSISQWDVKPDAGTLAAGLGLGLPSGDVMMGSCSSMFGNRPTLDFLGLGMGPNSALLGSYGGGFQVGTPNAGTPRPYTRGEIEVNPQDFWDGVLAERKQSGPTLH